MSTINVYKHPISGTLSQLQVKRNWMDNTDDSHAYKCFPVSLANSFGYGISFPEDITFVWDGISDSRADHVKVLSGNKYCSTGRANGTISFNTGFEFKTNKDITMLQMPVPNQFIDGVQAFTTLISTSFFRNAIPCVWKITRPHVEITVTAGTPVIALVPVSLSKIKNFELNVYDKDYSFEEDEVSKEYIKKSMQLSSEGKWTNFYRDGIDYNGNMVGEHEVKSLKLKINDFSKK